MLVVDDGGALREPRDVSWSGVASLRPSSGGWQGTESCEEHEQGRHVIFYLRSTTRRSCSFETLKKLRKSKCFITGRSHVQKRKAENNLDLSELYWWCHLPYVHGPHCTRTDQHLADRSHVRALHTWTSRRPQCQCTTPASDQPPRCMNGAQRGAGTPSIRKAWMASSSA
jgi:hypothetical protein